MKCPTCNVDLVKYQYSYRELVLTTLYCPLCNSKINTCGYGADESLNAALKKWEKVTGRGEVIEGVEVLPCAECGKQPMIVSFSEIFCSNKKCENKRRIRGYFFSAVEKWNNLNDKII